MKRRSGARRRANHGNSSNHSGDGQARFELLVQQGKVLYVACSNFAGWHIVQGCERAAAWNFLGPVAEQSLYNLTMRTIELEVAPACREYGLSILPWSPLAGSSLAGATAQLADGRRSALSDRFASFAPQLDQYAALCRELGEAPADVALAWLLHNPVVASPIIGPRTMSPPSTCAVGSCPAARPVRYPD